MVTPFLLFGAYLSAALDGRQFIAFRVLYPIPSLFAFDILPVTRVMREVLLYPGVILGSMQYGYYGYAWGRYRDGLASQKPFWLLVAVHLITMIGALWPLTGSA